MMRGAHFVAFALLAPALRAQSDAQPLTWDGLEARLAAESEAWFQGVALVLRDGEVVLSRGYGYSDREHEVPITPRTVFAIGSTPIDFTKAGILLLAEEEALGFEEPLTDFFDDVPEAKRAITVEQLMTGRSGLRDFHDLPTDRDPDHAYIDRGEAVRRILSQELLFEPGKGEAHSHSAWGLLAAILEIRSGRSYADFVRERLFAPAGMHDTGFNGEPVEPERLAIGYGEKRDGERNAPPYWGPTSWLVMGSGGMTSTALDLLAWNRALREGKLLSKSSLARYWAPRGALLDGGDMYGFEVLYTEGPESLFFLLSNAMDRATRPRFEALGRELHALVNALPAARYSLGITLEVDPERGARVRSVAAGSAASEAGLRTGDVLLTAGGVDLGRGPMSVLERWLRTGETVELEVLRGGERLRIALKPKPR